MSEHGNDKKRKDNIRQKQQDQKTKHKKRRGTITEYGEGVGASSINLNHRVLFKSSCVCKIVGLYLNLSRLLALRGFSVISQMTVTV